MKRLFPILLAAVTALAVSCMKDDDGVTPLPEAVDLGLFVDGKNIKWASLNLGASKEYEYGDYYAWGETEPHYAKGHSQDNPCKDWRVIDGKKMTGYDWDSYKWRTGPDFTFTKYNTISYSGNVDNNLELDRGDDPGDTTIDDVARAKLGGKWRMPTVAEWTELRTKCTWTWITQNGVKGYKVTGPNGNSIFLPAAGARRTIYLQDTGTSCRFWSSSLVEGNPVCAWAVSFQFHLDYNFCKIDTSRECGFPIRPVTE